MYAVRCMENVFAVKTKISLWQVALMPETEFEALDEQKKRKNYFNVQIQNILANSFLKWTEKKMSTR